MSPARKRFKPWKVNLVAQPGWEPWDPAGKISEMAFTMSLEYMQDIKAQNVYLWLAQDIAQALYKPRAESGPHEWSPRAQLTSVDLLLIANGTMEADSRLESTRQLIDDTVTWMFEAALMPSDRDIRDALIDAKRAVEDTFDLGKVSDPWELGYDNLWEPLLETGITLNGILSEMMGMGISYYREEGHYDRFLEFDLNKSSSPSMLLAAVPTKVRGWVTRSIEDDWKRLSQSLIERFFQTLARDMSFVDPGNRTSWKTSWNEALKTTDLKPIQKEMLAYVREIRKQEGSRL